jgi:hypothetical protein
MQWSRPEISNAVREVVRHMSSASETHVEAAHRIMQYCRDTPNRGLTLTPTEKWNGNKIFKFTINGRSDSNYASNPDDRRSVTGYRVSLNGAPIAHKSATQKHVTLSVTEAEGSAMVSCVQEMIYAKNVIESMGLEVEVPMIVECDNRGAVDLANNWSVGGRTRHVDVRLNFIRELIEAGTLNVRWIAGEENDSDIHTKNLGNPLFDKFTKVYSGNDEYYKADARAREGVASKVCAGVRESAQHDDEERGMRKRAVRWESDARH